MNFTDLILFYLIILAVLYIFILTGSLLLHSMHARRIRSWQGRQERFHQQVQSYLLSHSKLPPRMVLRGAFRIWALDELMRYEQKFTGESSDRLRVLLRDWGIISDTEKQVRHRQWHQRALGLHTIGVFRLKEMYPLVSKLLEDKHSGVREKALWTLGRIGSSSELTVMLKKIDAEAYEWYQLDRMSAILGELPIMDDQLPGIVIEHYDLLKTAFAKRCLLELVTKHGGYELIPFLAARMTSGSAEETIGILKALMKLHAYSVVKQVEELLEDQEQPSGVQTVAMKLLAALGSREEESTFERGLGSRHWWVRYFSGLGLAKMGEAGRNALQRLAAQHPDTYGRDMAKYFLQLLREEGALWKSIEKSLAMGS